jgi:hypothetical protein
MASDTTGSQNIVTKANPVVAPMAGQSMVSAASQNTVPLDLQIRYPPCPIGIPMTRLGHFLSGEQIELRLPNWSLRGQFVAIIGIPINGQPPQAENVSVYRHSSKLLTANDPGMLGSYSIAPNTYPVVVLFYDLKLWMAIDSQESDVTKAPALKPVINRLVSGYNRILNVSKAVQILTTTGRPVDFFLSASTATLQAIARESVSKYLLPTQIATEVDALVKVWKAAILSLRTETLFRPMDLIEMNDGTTILKYDNVAANFGKVFYTYVPTLDDSPAYLAFAKESQPDTTIIEPNEVTIKFNDNRFGGLSPTMWLKVGDREIPAGYYKSMLHVGRGVWQELTSTTETVQFTLLYYADFQKRESLLFNIDKSGKITYGFIPPSPTSPVLATAQSITAGGVE